MKKNYVVIYLIIFLYFILLSLNYTTLSMDEILCYGMSKRIADGYIPYKDFNLILTPLFFYFGTVFSKSLLLFRVYGVLINTSIVFLIYYMYKKNKIEDQLCIILVLFICTLLSLIAFANYNTLLLLSLMILYLAAYRFFKEMTSNNSFLFGFALSFTLLIKQNIPAILIATFTVMLLYMLIRRYIPLKTFIYYAIGGIIPVTIFVSQAFFNGSLGDFIDYAIFGLTSFSNNRILDKGFQSQYILILATVVITVFFTKNLYKSKHDKLINMMTLILSLGSFMLIYPLVDLYHSIILLVFNIFLSFNILKDLKFNLRFGKAVIGFYIVIMCIIIFQSLNPSNEGFVRSNVEYYNNILFNKSIEKNVTEVSCFIRQQEKRGFDVAIIDGSAYLYNIPADDNNGILDLLIVGNIGKISKNEIIELIEKKDIILMPEYFGPYDIKEIREYIINNYVQDKTIGNMKIYVKQ